MRYLHYLENVLIDDEVVLEPRLSPHDPERSVRMWSSAAEQFGARQDRANEDPDYVLPDMAEDPLTLTFTRTEPFGSRLPPAP